LEGGVILKELEKTLKTFFILKNIPSSLVTFSFFKETVAQDLVAKKRFDCAEHTVGKMCLNVFYCILPNLLPSYNLQTIGSLSMVTELFKTVLVSFW
jgi:hypothetical protein